MPKFMGSYITPTRRQIFTPIRANCKIEVSIYIWTFIFCFDNLPFIKVRRTFISWNNTGHSYQFSFSCLPKRLITGLPGQSNVPRQFRFQTQIPESEQAQHPSRTSTPGSSGVSPPVTRADFFLDMDWENSYAESSHWGLIWQATQWEEAEWPEGYLLIKKSCIGA